MGESCCSCWVAQSDFQTKACYSWLVHQVVVFCGLCMGLIEVGLFCLFVWLGGVVWLGGLVFGSF